MLNPQKTAELIKKEAKKQGVSIRKLLDSCELGANTIGKMSNGKDVTVETLVKIADYLAVSVDTLLGREGGEKNISSPIFKNRDDIVKKLNALSDDKIDQVIGYIDGLTDK